MGKLASLSSGLLARKGQARPAMRPQGFAGYTAQVEDLGWNDMGTGPAEPAVLPPVLVERAELAAVVDAPAPEPVAAPAAEDRRPVSVATATRIRRETTHADKAAFTLRLDAARHLRLRLASAVAGRSAQALMTDALDALLATVPEVEALVAQLPPPTRARGRKTS